jgi:hypothetical protein
MTAYQPFGSFVPPTPVVFVDVNGNPVGASVGAGGDASAANQTTQISHESRLTSSASGVAHASPLATTAFMVGLQYRATVPTWADLEQGSLLADVNGRLLVAPSGGFATVGATVTRPADTTAYAIGDLVANSTTAGSVVPMTIAVSRLIDKDFSILRARLKKTGTSITNAQFRVHLYKDTPTCTNGDNSAWLTTESTYLGGLDVTMDKVFSDFAKGIGAANTAPAISGLPSVGTVDIFALIEARAAYTPVSAEVFTLTLEVLQS